MKKNCIRIIKTAPIAAASALAISLTPAPAYAISDASAIIGYLATTFAPFISNLMGKWGQAIQSEIQRKADEQMRNAQAIAKNEQDERLRLQTIEINEKMRQPALTCASMAMSDNLAKIDARVRHAARQASRQQNQSVISNKNAGAAVLGSYENAMRKYCTEADEALGRCRVADIPEPKFAGADISADMVFTNAGDPGSKSYMPGQKSAVSDYIKRITGSVLPESLAARDKRYESTPTGKAYADMVRRYAAFMSMANYSLNSIAASHEPEQGLGERTMMSARVGKDASMMAVIDAYVQEKFSPNSIKDQAQQMQAEVILRDMAQTNAFRLWIEYQNLNQTQRVEAMNAMQLALMTESQLKPQLAAQRAAATRSSTARQ